MGKKYVIIYIISFQSRTVCKSSHRSWKFIALWIKNDFFNPFFIFWGLKCNRNAPLQLFFCPLQIRQAGSL